MFDYEFEIKGNKIKIMDEYGCYWHPEVKITTSIIYDADGSFAKPSKVFDRILKLVYGDEYSLADMASDIDAERYDLITTRLAISARFDILAQIPYRKLLRKIAESINDQILQNIVDSNY